MEKPDSSFLSKKEEWVDYKNNVIMFINVNVGS